ncbi:hypothetical protein ZIOFF_045498 [Zingiber officinale]|uniref:Metal tolerance protein C4 n=1 Tax=Zingiber officinale TaxID=94328 RepID=A0A8J5GD75_ZINOF|nr:hypothetical protein ZIOFF_045498 [Zingiber officinale]
MRAPLTVVVTLRRLRDHLSADLRPSPPFPFLPFSSSSGCIGAPHASCLSSLVPVSLARKRIAIGHGSCFQFPLCFPAARHRFKFLFMEVGDPSFYLFMVACDSCACGLFFQVWAQTVVHGMQNLWKAHPPENMHYAALVIGGSFLVECASLLVAINAVKKGAAAEGMKLWDYVWHGHDPTSVAVMTEDGAPVTGIAIAAASLVALKTGNPIYDPIGSIIVENLLGMVALFLIQRYRHALIGRAIDDHDIEKSITVVDFHYDCNSEFAGVVEGEDVVEAFGSEADRLESEIQKIVPGISKVDMESH